MNEKLRKTIKDLIKITHFHKRIILHKFFKLNQRMSLSHEKRSIFPKTKYDHLPYITRDVNCLLQLKRILSANSSSSILSSNYNALRAFFYFIPLSPDSRDNRGHFWLK